MSIPSSVESLPEEQDSGKTRPISRWVAKSFGSILDSAPVDDSDLTQPFEKIPEELNSLNYLRTFEPPADTRNLYREIKDLLSPRTPWNRAEAEKLAAKSLWIDDFLTTLKSKPHLSYSSEPKFSSPSPNYTACKQAAAILRLRHRIAISSGQFETGVQTLEQLAFLSDLFNQSNGSIVDFLIGKALRSIHLSEIRRVLENAVIPDKILHHYLGRTRHPYSDKSRDLTKVYLNEYQQIAGLIKLLNSSSNNLSPLRFSIPNSPLFYFVNTPGFRSVFTLQKHRTIGIISHHFRTITKQVSLPPNKRQLPPETLFSQSRVIHETLFGNFEGIRMIRLAIPAFEKIIESVDLLQVEEDLTHLLVGLKIYESKHGTLPSHLAQLSPDIIPVLPFDHFSRKFYQYDRDKRRIWSVGNDFVNDGGLDLNEGSPELLVKNMAHEPTYQIP